MARARRAEFSATSAQPSSAAEKGRGQAEDASSPFQGTHMPARQYCDFPRDRHGTNLFSILAPDADLEVDHLAAVLAPGGTRHHLRVVVAVHKRPRDLVGLGLDGVRNRTGLNQGERRVLLPYFLKIDGPLSPPASLLFMSISPSRKKSRLVLSCGFGRNGCFSSPS